MIPQCDGCGRVRVDGEWQHRPEIQPGVMGTCPTCGTWRHKVAQARYYREARGVARRAAKGYGPAPEGVDPFAGMNDTPLELALGGYEDSE